MKFRIPVARPELGPEEEANLQEAVRSGWVSSQGPFIARFEEEFARYCGVRYGVATSSGTTALHLALTALGIGPGDEVLVPSLTFIATTNAVTYTGARPVFVDVRRDYWCMDPEDLARKVTPRSRAVIPVHLYGHPCEMDAILRIAERHGLAVVEDCAEAHGAEYRGRRVGSFGTIACFSFYGNKIITTGEGGMCLTDDEALYRRMRLLRDHGQDPGRRYWHPVVGFNYRMTNLQAGVGLAQFRRLEEFLARRRRIVEWYRSALGDLPGVETSPEMPWARNAFWFFCLVLTDACPVDRDTLMARLEEQGIETRPFFWANHLLPPYEGTGSAPVAEWLCRRGVNLPTYPSLTREEVEFVARAVREALNA